MILIKISLILWCCVLFDQTVVECSGDNVNTVIRHKRVINDGLKGLLLEALELENSFSVLANSSIVTAQYQSLFDRVEGVRSSGFDEDNSQALFYLESVLRSRLIDVNKEPSLIIDLHSYADFLVSEIAKRNKKMPEIQNINDVDLKANLNRQGFKANVNFILTEYHNFVEGIRFAYFPYAACYLESLRQLNSSTSYDNLIAMTTAFTNQLIESKRYIEDLNSRDIRYLGGSEPKDAFCIWKNSEVRDKIRQLFKGEEITLVADVKTATNQLNALKFKQLNLVFRPSNQTVHNRLDRALKYYTIFLDHSGRSAYRFNNHFYQLTTQPMLLFFSYETDQNQKPFHQNGIFTKLRESRPKLSPYTEWTLKLSSSSNSFRRLTRFEQSDIDIELHGSGSYVDESMQICEEEKVSRFYTPTEK